MPSRRGKKREAELQRFRKLAETLGINPDELMKEVPSTEIGEAANQRRAIEAESVLYYIEVKGKGFTEKNCKNCKAPFLSTYRAVGYCSDHCRSISLERVGIIWNYHGRRDEDRWNVKGQGYIPKVISADATQVLKESGNYYSGNED